MKILLLILALISPALAQDSPGGGILEKKVGETITITWEYEDDVADEVQNWIICRQVGVSGSTTCVTASTEKRFFLWPMPGGTTPEYRIRVYAQSSEGIGFAGPELIVMRKK